MTAKIKISKKHLRKIIKEVLYQYLGCEYKFQMGGWQDKSNVINRYKTYEGIRKTIEKIDLQNITDEKRTEKIKEALANLGCKQKLRVSTNRLPKELTQQYGGSFSNHEWLFDMFWYREPQDSDSVGITKSVEGYGYLLKKAVLALESEWGGVRKEDKTNDPYGAVKYDFQKLVVANVEHRVMIFQEQNNDNDLDKITRYIKKQIEIFPMPYGSTIMCIAYDKKFSSFRYQIFIKD